MAGIVMGRSKLSSLLAGEEQRSREALDEILRYYQVKPQEMDDQLQRELGADFNELLEYHFRPSGIMRRTVTLKGKWYRHGIGALLGERNGAVIALIPSGLTGYRFWDPESGKRVKVTRKTAAGIAAEAICFYKPFPLRSLGIKELLLYIMHTLAPSDLVLTALATLAVTLVGLLLPYANQLIFAQVVPAGNVQLLLAVTAFLLGVTVAKTLFSVISSLVKARIDTKMNLAVQSAAMMRVLSLPADFFKRHSAGELSSRVTRINSLCSMLVNALLTTGLTSLFSLVYIGQIFHYSPALAAPALMIIFATVLFSSLSTLVQMKISRKQMELAARKSGLEYALITGVQKIKLSGSEKRAFAKWAQQYQKSAQLSYDPPTLIKLNSVIGTAISLLGSIAIYYFAVASKIGVADFMAFTVAYGMVGGAFSSLSSMALTFANIRPVLENVRPLLQAVPEIAAGKKLVTRLSGGIELNNIFFRYTEPMPLVLDNLSLKIRPGEYLAIVGKTGCGKSTLLRIMLGFEKPQKGAVYYDGQNIETIDLRSLRRRIGVVMQNGKLFQGNVYSNITIAAPWLTMEDAWAAAEIAGIAADIRRMPMGMHTIIAEGSGGVSGGQRQRLMIARAVAPRPRILMFDEATSALDNLTQKIVSDSLSKLKCTRLVIAHRLSTIKQCDRIIVLDQGRIVEDGKYDRLIAQGGFFAELVERQRLDTGQGKS